MHRRNGSVECGVREWETTRWRVGVQGRKVEVQGKRERVRMRVVYVRINKGK
jgi:hypothetical protein